MDRDIRELQRRRDRDPQDREARLFLDRARRRSWTPGPDLAAALARLIFEALARRAERLAKRPISAAALLGQVLADPALIDPGAPYRPLLEGLCQEPRPAVGAGEFSEYGRFFESLLRAVPLASLLQIGELPIGLELIEDFLNANAELEDRGDYVWLQELVPLPELAGAASPEAVAREAIGLLDASLYRQLQSSGAPGREPWASRGEPGVAPPLAGDEFRELFQALLVLFLGPSWTTFDTPYRWRACVSRLSLIQRGEDWFAFAVQLL